MPGLSHRPDVNKRPKFLFDPSDVHSLTSIYCSDDGFRAGDQVIEVGIVDQVTEIETID